MTSVTLGATPFSMLAIVVRRDSLTTVTLQTTSVMRSRCGRRSFHFLRFTSSLAYARTSFAGPISRSRP